MNIQIIPYKSDLCDTGGSFAAEDMTLIKATLRKASSETEAGSARH